MTNRYETYLYSRKNLLFLGVFFFTTFGIAQTNKLNTLLIECEDNIKRLHLSNIEIDLELEAVETFIEKGVNNDSIIEAYITYAYWVYDYDKNKSITYNKKAITCIEECNIKNNYLIQETLYNLGYTYTKKEDYNSAIDVYKEIILTDPSSGFSVKSYNKLAFCYAKLQDYISAVDYYKYYKDYLENQSQTNLPSLFSVYYNIATNQLNIKTKERLEDGIFYAKKVDSLCNVLSTPPTWKFSAKFVLGELYDQHLSRNVEVSNSYFDEALQIAYSISDTSRIKNVYYGKANMYNNLDHKKSLAYLDTLSSLTSRKGIEDIKDAYRYQYARGHTYAYYGDFEKSVLHYSYAINVLIGIPIEKFENLQFDDIKNTSHNKELLYIIPLIAETYLAYYQETKGQDKLKLAIHYFKIADQIIDSLKENSSTEITSRLFWSNLRSQVYGKAIRACYLNDDIDLAFYFSEKSKALLLLEDLAKETYKKALYDTDVEVEKEKSLKQQILENEKLLSKSTSEELKDSLDKENIYLKTRLSILDKNKESDIKISPSIISLNQLQSTIKTDEVFLEYHISINDDYSLDRNNENGFLFVITKDEIKLLELNQLRGLKSNVSALIDQSKKVFKTSEDISSFHRKSYQVFEQLFPDPEIRNAILNKKLAIVTDNILSFLPFEILSTNKNELNYLIEESSIRYSYSYSFLQTKNESEKKDIAFLAMAPVHFKDKQLNKLANSENEVALLSKYFNGTIFAEKEATKDNFLRKSKDVSVIHLATHANASENGVNPWISFYDQKISLQELYLEKVENALVVLSSCNTSLGKQESGEGVMSLARGFFYAGADSVVASLWSVDDRATTFIMDEFYNNLSKGTSKSKALQLAKTTYLKEYSHSELSPYYWASLTVLGNDSPIMESSSSLYLGVIILGILILGILFFRKRVRT